MTCKYCGHLRECIADANKDGNEHNLDFEGEKYCDCFKRSTNADRIRSMTDEELADMRVRYNPVTGMYTADTGEAYYDFVSAMEAELDWLQQPAEVE
jgi:hypothetical protein